MCQIDLTRPAEVFQSAHRNFKQVVDINEKKYYYLRTIVFLITFNSYKISYNNLL